MIDAMIGSGYRQHKTFEALEQHAALFEEEELRLKPRLQTEHHTGVATN
jgi:hypothetical protein